MSKAYVDNLVNPKPNNKIIGFQKQCPKCMGSGRNTPMMSGMVMVPGINDMMPKKKLGLFVCDRCNGTGKIQSIEPLMMNK